MRIVIALGGNALLKRGEPMTAGHQRANVRVGAQALARVAREHELVISHGNGPQVGLLALQGEAYKDVESYPLDVLGAETQGMIGYLVEQEVGNLLPEERPLATILTMVEIDPDDPAFTDPTKFVGPVYDEAQAKALAADKGWSVKAGRRVLAAGRPISPAEADLRDPADALAARTRRRRHLRRGRRHPDDVRPRSGALPRRRRGGHRQGPRKQPARPRARRRPVHHGHRRRWGVHRLGHSPHRRASGGRRRNSSTRWTCPRVRWARRSTPRWSSWRRPGNAPPSGRSRRSTDWSKVAAAHRSLRRRKSDGVVRRALGGGQAPHGHRPPAGAQPEAADPRQPRRAAVRRRPVGRAGPVGARPVRRPDARARRRGAVRAGSARRGARGERGCPPAAHLGRRRRSSRRPEPGRGRSRRLVRAAAGRACPAPHRRPDRRGVRARPRQAGQDVPHRRRHRRREPVRPAAPPQHAVHARLVVLDLRRRLDQSDVLARTSSRGLQHGRDLPRPPAIPGRGPSSTGIRSSARTRSSRSRTSARPRWRVATSRSSARGRSPSACPSARPDG